MTAAPAPRATVRSHASRSPGRPPSRPRGLGAAVVIGFSFTTPPSKREPERSGERRRSRPRGGRDLVLWPRRCSASMLNGRQPARRGRKVAMLIADRMDRILCGATAALTLIVAAAGLLRPDLYVGLVAPSLLPGAAAQDALS